jgi:hypothetical protein
MHRRVLGYCLNHTESFGQLFPYKTAPAILHACTPPPVNGQPQAALPQYCGTAVIGHSFFEKALCGMVKRLKNFLKLDAIMA